MATVTTFANADASASSIGFAVPIASGLQGWWFLGTDKPTSQQNLASGGSAGVIAGSPAFNAGYVSFGGFSTGQWMDTAISETPDLTFLAVARSSGTFVAPQLPMFMSTFGVDPQNGTSTASKGTSLNVVGTGSGAPDGRIGGVSFYNNGGTPTLEQTFLDAPHIGDTFKMIGLRVASAAGTTVTVNDLSDGTNATVTNASPRIVNATNKVRIGASTVASYAAPCDIAFAAVYSRALLDAEMQSTYAFVKSFLGAKRGIAI